MVKCKLCPQPRNGCEALIWWKPIYVCMYVCTCKRVSRYINIYIYIC